MAPLLKRKGTGFQPTQVLVYTVYPRSSDPFYIGGYCIKWVTTSRTYSRCTIMKSLRLMTHHNFGNFNHRSTIWTYVGRLRSTHCKKFFETIQTRLLLPHTRCLPHPGHEQWKVLYFSHSHTC